MGFDASFWKWICVFAGGLIWIVLMAYLLTYWTDWWSSAHRFMVLLKWYRLKAWLYMCLVVSITLLSVAFFKWRPCYIFFYLLWSADISNSCTGGRTGCGWRKSSIPWRDGTKHIFKVRHKFYFCSVIYPSPYAVYLHVAVSSGMLFSCYHLLALWQKWMVETAFAR